MGVLLGASGVMTLVSSSEVKTSNPGIPIYNGIAMDQKIADGISQPITQQDLSSSTSGKKVSFSNYNYDKDGINLIFPEAVASNNNNGIVTDITGNATGTVDGTPVGGNVSITFYPTTQVSNQDSIDLSGQTLPPGAIIGNDSGVPTYTYPNGADIFGTNITGSVTVYYYESQNRFVIKTSDPIILQDYKINTSELTLDAGTAVNQPYNKFSYEPLYNIDNGTGDFKLDNSAVSIEKLNGNINFGNYKTGSPHTIMDLKNPSIVSDDLYSPSVYNWMQSDSLIAKLEAGIPKLDFASGSYNINQAFKSPPMSQFSVRYLDNWMQYIPATPQNVIVGSSGNINAAEDINIDNIGFTSSSTSGNVTIDGKDGSLNTVDSETDPITVGPPGIKARYNFTGANMVAGTAASILSITNTDTSTMSITAGSGSPVLIAPTKTKDIGQKVIK